ncbi:MAG: RNA-binding protein [Thermoplasmata archaeon]|nr:DUF1947 domain-containing protein [Euryarchaeota archaeon]RLF66664.1 MAG: RNA-binding protein [Thermoplasmata archaeon]
MKLRRRHVLSKRDLKKLSRIIKEYWDIDLMDYDTTWEIGDLDKHSIILEDGIPMFIITRHEKYGEIIVPTIVFLIRHNISKKYVIVDSGAVPYISRGADVMRPGIVDCDKSIKIGDIVYIKGENRQNPIGVGIALMSCEEMLTKEKGKAVEVIHFINDDIMVLIRRTLENIKART